MARNLFSMIGRGPLPNGRGSAGVVVRGLLLSALAVGLSPVGSWAQNEKSPDEEKPQPQQAPTPSQDQIDAMRRALEGRSGQNQPAPTQPTNRAPAQANVPATAPSTAAAPDGESAVELKLSGNEITVDTLDSGEIVIIGNDSDIQVLQDFIEELDRERPQKEFVLHKLENANADDAAGKLQEIAGQIWPGMQNMPAESVSVMAVTSNLLGILAPASKIDRMIELAQAIDEEVGGMLPKFETMKFVLKNRKAPEVAEQLKKIIDNLQRRQGATEAEQITLEVNDADNSIVIFGPSTLREQVQKLINEIDIEPTSKFSHVKLAVFPLYNAVADDLSDVLKDMLATSSGQEAVQETIRRLSIIKRESDGTLTELKPLDLDKPLRLIPDKGTNSIMVATTEENIEPLGAIIELLDSFPTGHEMNLKIFPLKFADADAVKEMLKSMFDEGKKLPERAPGGNKTEAVPEGVVGEALVYNIGLAVDKRTNTLLVSGRTEQLALAQIVVSEVDVPVSSVKFPLKLLFLGKNVDASRVRGIIDELFTKRIELLENTEAGKLAVAREKVFLAVDIRSNALIVSAADENLAEIERITTALDVAPDRLIENIRILNCVNTNAADLADKIKELWERKAALVGEGEVKDTPILVADSRSNSLIIASSPEDYAEIDSLISRLEAQPLSPIAEIRLLPLANNDAKQTGDMLKTLFEERAKQRLTSGQDPSPSDQVAVAVDAATNIILVASSRENFEEMSRIIEAIDKEPAIEGVVRLYILKRAEASTVTKKVKELFDQGLYNPMVGLESEIIKERNKVAIISDPRINAVIVSAAKPNLSIIETLIEKMDGEMSPMLGDDTRIVHLEFADAVQMAEMLKKLFEERKSEAAEPDLFRKPTLIPDEHSNTLILAGAPDIMQRSLDLVKQLDKPAGPPSSVFEVYPMEYGSAVKLAKKMQDLFDKRAEGRDENAAPINIQADEASNALIASASHDDHLLIRGLLDLLDKPSSISKQFQIFPLAQAKAEKIAETLDQLFKQQGEGATGRADAIAVQPDVRSNALVVWASSTELENIAAIINKLDTTTPAMEMMMKVVRLKQALAEDFAKVFEETLFNGQQSTDESGAVLVSFTQQLDDGTRVVRKLVRENITIRPDPRTNSLMVMAPASSMDMLEAMILDFDRISPVTAEIRIFQLANADADEMVTKLNEIFGTEASQQQGGNTMEQRIQFAAEGGAGAAAAGAAGAAGGEGGGARQPLRFTSDRRTNSVVAAGNPVDLRMVEDLIRELDAQDIEDRVQDVYKARYLTSEAISAAVKSFNDSENELFSGLDDQTSIRRRADKKVSVVSDKDSNTVLVGAGPRNYDRVMDLVRRMDRPEPQVMISVLIAEVSMDERLELGVEFAAQDLNFSEKAVVGPNGVIQGPNFDVIGGTDIGAAGTGFGGLSLTVSGEDFSFLFRALESESQLEVLSRPTILVQNNSEGKITIGDRVPIISGTTSAGGQSSTQVQYEDVGIKLNVTPHINPDGYVNLEINPEISQISNQSLQVSEGLTAAVFSERSAETTVTVKDGETIILGGLITENNDTSTNKIPILGDLPWIGHLFRVDSKVNTKTELLVVLTVNVLRTEDDLRLRSEQERELTGRFPERIKRSPLMEGLRIRPEEDQFGPITPDEPGKPVEPSPPPATNHKDRSIYGPVPRTYGPPRPTASPQIGDASSKPTYGPRLVRSESTAP